MLFLYLLICYYVFKIILSKICSYVLLSEKKYVNMFLRPFGSKR